MKAHWARFLDIVATQTSAEPALAYMAGLAGELIGSRLTTATLFDVPAGRLRRIYTQNPQAYAVGGFKPIPDNKWTDILIRQKRIYTALSIGAIAEDFFDWELIRSLGCESIANLPVVVGGEVVGAVNLLNVAGHYTADRLERAADLMPFATIAFLLALREAEA